ncbi:uncharacterized protein LOC134691674 [Mytilus trossulus]|uniref:uncharacterized protein LOC134691674 n=1 Tax=Mytilus trossulus TaxID=6551 RepID=UPI003004C626
MNGNFRKQDNHEDEHLSGIRKNSTREIYGVRRFPYRGRRTYAPILSQPLDGGMVILNDVFGLTISQFERMYKACLDRRNTKEQWITNLRYPDKSSKEYLEYLDNCTDCNKGHLLWLENNPKEKYLYEQLVHTVGTKIDIRKRQRLFIILDRIINTGLANRTHIASGSLAEGLDLPGSDLDIMYVLNDLEVIRNVKNVKYPVQSTTFFMETDIAHPGFARFILR